MNLTKPVVQTLTYSASTDQEIDLPTEGIITRVDLEMSITGSGGMAGAASVQALWRVLNTLKIQGGSGITYFSMGLVQSGIMLHYINLLDFPSTTWREIVATTQAVGYRLHFGSRPRDEYGRDNPFDLTAGIPAEDENNLKLIWGCPANTVMDDTITISAATMKATVHYVLGANKARLMVPRSTSEQYNPTTTQSDLGGERNIPTGGSVRRIVIMCLDHQTKTAGGPLLKDDQVTEMGVLLTKNNQRVIVTRTKAAELVQPWFDGMATVDTPNTAEPWTVPGLFSLDLRQVADHDYGIDTVRDKLQTGDIVLGLTIGAYTSGDLENIWYDVLVPYGS